MKQATQEFVAALTDSEVDDVLDALIKRQRDDARKRALEYANLLVSTLKVAQRPDLAQKIAVVIKEL